MKKSVIIIANDDGYRLSPIPIDMIEIADENRIKIIRKAMGIIRTTKGFIRFFKWLLPESTCTDKDIVVKRSITWNVDEAEWVKSMDMVYIKNIRSCPYQFAITRMIKGKEEEGAKKKIELVLKPGGWVEITDDKITVLDSYIITHEEYHKGDTTFESMKK